MGGVRFSARSGLWVSGSSRLQTWVLGEKRILCSLRSTALQTVRWKARTQKAFCSSSGASLPLQQSVHQISGPYTSCPRTDKPQNDPLGDGGVLGVLVAHVGTHKRSNVESEGSNTFHGCAVFVSVVPAACEDNAHFL